MRFLCFAFNNIPRCVLYVRAAADRLTDWGRPVFPPLRTVPTWWWSSPSPARGTCPTAPWSPGCRRSWPSPRWGRRGWWGWAAPCTPRARSRWSPRARPGRTGLPEAAGCTRTSPRTALWTREIREMTLNPTKISNIFILFFKLFHNYEKKTEYLFPHLSYNKCVIFDLLNISERKEINEERKHRFF